MSWWNSGSSPSSARVLRGPRVSATRPASLLVDPEKLRLYRAPEIEEDGHEANGHPVNGHDSPGDSDLAAHHVAADPEQLAADLERLAAVIDAARSEGYAEGHRRGLEEGATAVHAEIDESTRISEERRAADVASAASALLSAVERVEEARTQAVTVAEVDCAELSFKLTRSLLQRETQLSERPTVESIVRALALAPTNEAVTIRLNPDDISTLSGFDMSSLGRECTVIADELVEHAGCIVDVGPTRIDAQLGRALGRVRKVLLGMGHTHDHADPENGLPPVLVSAEAGG